jgi:hypothetical protein
LFRVYDVKAEPQGGFVCTSSRGDDT